MPPCRFKRHLYYFARVRGTLGRPIRKGGTEAVRRQIVALHAAQQHQHGHVRHRQCSPRAGKHRRARVRCRVRHQRQWQHLFQDVECRIG
jgi:hypothetical protein